ncbi:MAG: hypothetical protein ABIF01_02450 [Candidatus Micrarchaeota archaeon]
MRHRPQLLIIFVMLLQPLIFSEINVQYAEIVPQLIADNSDPDCQAFITYGGPGEPTVNYYIWDSKGGRDNPTHFGIATCIGSNWQTGKACHSSFFNPKPLSGVVYCAIEASTDKEVAGKCSIAARTCSDCPSGCGDAKCSGGETSSTCAQDCMFYGVEVKILSPECYATLHRGETFLLKISARKDGAPLKNAKVSSSGFFGSSALIEESANTGIYTAESTVPTTSEGVLSINFFVSDEGRVEKRTALVWVTPTLKVTANVLPIQKLGDIIPVTGNISSLGMPANGHAEVAFYSPSGRLMHIEQVIVSNGTFISYYHGALNDEVGNWSITINTTDEFKNSGSWSGLFLLAEFAPGSFLEVEHISPVVGVYSRGSTVSVTVRVKKEGQPLTGANAMFFTPDNKPVEMLEVGGGVYSATYTINQNDPLGVWAVITRASYKVDSGVVEGLSSHKVSIAESTLSIDITRPERASFGYGDTVEVVATASYPGGDPVNASRAFVSVRNEKIHMEQTQPGTFVAYYQIPPEREGEAILTVSIQDEYGNSGTKSATMEISGESLLFMLDRNRFIIIPAAIAIVIAAVTFCRNCIFASRKNRLIKRKDELIKLQAKLQAQYLKEGVIDRKTFYDLSAKYDSELQRIEHELSEIEDKGMKEVSK